MCKLFTKYEKEIEQYCNDNGLSFKKACTMSQCWGKNDIWLQHFDKKRGTKGLLDETPAPIVLIISVNHNKLHFEQTEFTKQYLV